MRTSGMRLGATAPMRTSGTRLGSDSYYFSLFHMLFFVLLLFLFYFVGFEIYLGFCLILLCFDLRKYLAAMVVVVVGGCFGGCRSVVSFLVFID
uniref:NADH dehydrogenase subunit 4L n=1 Tax=Cannabis sativa TaxID=3483 RepID=A0A803RCE4_CANSA